MYSKRPQLQSLEIRKSPDVSSKEKKSSKSSKKTNGSGSSIGSTSGGNEDSKDIRHIEIISSPISDYDVDDGEDGEENGSTATSNSNENLKEGNLQSFINKRSTFFIWREDLFFIFVIDFVNEGSFKDAIST